LDELPIFLSYELGRLIDDYYRCEDLIVKKQIQRDIQLLSEAIVICDESS
jgi:hypothetical protein